MTDIVNAKVVEEVAPKWFRYVIQWQNQQGTQAAILRDSLEHAREWAAMVGEARIIDTAPEPGPAMSPQVRELVAAARELLVTHPRDTPDRRLAAALKPFEEAR